jgi:hypothetical protein
VICNNVNVGNEKKMFSVYYCFDNMIWQKKVKSTLVCTYLEKDFNIAVLQNVYRKYVRKNFKKRSL